MKNTITALLIILLVGVTGVAAYLYVSLNSVKDDLQILQYRVDEIQYTAESEMELEPITSSEKTDKDITGYFLIEDRDRIATAFTEEFDSKNQYITTVGIQSVDGYISYKDGNLIVDNVYDKKFTLPVDKTFSTYGKEVTTPRKNIPVIQETNHEACKKEVDESGMYLISPRCFGEDKDYIYAWSGRATETVEYTIKRIKK